MKRAEKSPLDPESAVHLGLGATQRIRSHQGLVGTRWVGTEGTRSGALLVRVALNEELLISQAQGPTTRSMSVIA